MTRNILWRGIEYNSLESCVLTNSDEGAEIKSSIIGMYNNVIYKVEYQIKTNGHWETIFFEINAQLNNKTNIISYRSDGKGNWFSDGNLIEKFSGCIDIDISLTPFTNTLPINRLKLVEKKEKIIKVLYLDILGQEVKAVHQKYTRLSQTDYRYENVPNDFESIISVDETGLVVTYPQLFKREFVQECNNALS